LITSTGSRVSYVYYNLNTLKVEQDCLFPADTQALLGRSDDGVTLHNCGEVGSYLCVLTVPERSFEPFIRLKKVKGMYSSSWEPISELRGITCHMESHTCHPTCERPPL